MHGDNAAVRTKVANLYSFQRGFPGKPREILALSEPDFRGVAGIERRKGVVNPLSGGIFTGGCMGNDILMNVIIDPVC